MPSFRHTATTIILLAISACSPYERYVSFDMENGFQKNDGAVEPTPFAYHIDFLNDRDNTILTLTDATALDEPEECCNAKSVITTPTTLATLTFVMDEGPLENRFYVYDPIPDENVFECTDVRLRIDGGANQSAGDDDSTTASSLDIYAKSSNQEREDTITFAVLRYQQKENTLNLKYLVETQGGYTVKGAYLGDLEHLAFPDDCICPNYD